MYFCWCQSNPEYHHARDGQEFARWVRDAAKTKPLSPLFLNGLWNDFREERRLAKREEILFGPKANTGEPAQEQRQDLDQLDDGELERLRTETLKLRAQQLRRRA